MLAWIWPWISAIPETRAVQCCIPLQVHTLSTNIISLKVPSIPIFVFVDSANHRGVLLALMGRVLHLQPTNHHHWLLLLLWSSFINSVKLICLNQLTLAAQLWKWKKIPMKEKFFVFCTKLYFFRQRLLLSLSLHICSSYKQKKLNKN